jgi:hypothetical protein
MSNKSVNRTGLSLTKRRHSTHSEKWVGHWVAPRFGLIFGLAQKLPLGVIFGRIFGLDALIHSVLLRFWLWQSRVFPLKAVTFLEDVTTRHLLQRVFLAVSAGITLTFGENCSLG